MDATRLIIAGRFIDGTGAEVQKNKLISIKDGLIDSIDDASNLPKTSAVQVDDYSHGIILPALADCSVSLARSPSIQITKDSELNEQQQQTLLLRHIHDCHSHGVLSIIENDIIDSLLADTEYEPSIDIRTHEDVIKLQYSNSVDDSEQKASLNYSELCNLIKNRGTKKTIVVANGPQQIAEALEAGCDGIEQGYLISRENLETMAEKNILWIPNIIRAQNALNSSAAGGDVCCRFSLRYAAPGKPIPGAEEFWQELLDKQLKQLQLARELGVKTAIGTGAGSPGTLHGESVIEEIKLFMKAGFTLTEAIQAASTNSADFCNLTDAGPLSVGKPATFLITRGSIKQLPRKLSYLEAIYINGQPSSSYQKNPIKSV